MFKAKQVIPATAMIKNFASIARLLHARPQALLITQRNKEPLVLVNAEIFEDLLQFRLDADTAANISQTAGSSSVL